MATAELDTLHAAPSPGAGDTHRGPEPRLVGVGTGDDVPTALLAPAVRAFRSSHGRTGTAAIAAPGRALVRDLAAWALDLALLAHRDDDLEATVVVRCPAVALVRADDALADRDRVTHRDLDRRPIVTTGPGTIGHRCASRLPTADAPALHHVAADASTVGLLVAAGVGVGLVPGWSAAVEPLVRAGALTARPVEDGGPDDALVLLASRDGARTTAVVDLHRLLVEHVRRAVAARPGNTLAPAVGGR